MHQDFDIVNSCNFTTAHIYASVFRKNLLFHPSLF